MVSAVEFYLVFIDSKGQVECCKLWVFGEFFWGDAKEEGFDFKVVEGDVPIVVCYLYPIKFLDEFLRFFLGVKVSVVFSFGVVDCVGIADVVVCVEDVGFRQLIDVCLGVFGRLADFFCCGFFYGDDGG